MKNRKLFAGILLLLVTGVAGAQEAKLEGIIPDAAGQAMIPVGLTLELNKRISIDANVSYLISYPDRRGARGERICVLIGTVGTTQGAQFELKHGTNGMETVILGGFAHAYGFRPFIGSNNGATTTDASRVLVETAVSPNADRFTFVSSHDPANRMDVWTDETPP
ncbi:MAG: hypothetical protein ACYTJ0_03485, partial [Planctomycetota bacterium]